VDHDVREGAGDCDAGDAFAAADLGDAQRLAGDKPGVHSGQGGQPFLQQVVHEHGPGEGGLQIVDGVVGIGDAATGAERLDNGGHHAAGLGDERGHGSGVGRAVRVEQHVRVGVRQRVAPRLASAPTSSTSRMPMTACCSSHSRA
jgi:hypothetical protein